MIFRVVSLVVFLVFVAGALLVHFRQQDMVSGEPDRGGVVKTDDIPRPPAKGPYAKAVVDGVLVHDFAGLLQMVPHLGGHRCQQGSQPRLTRQRG